MTAKEQITEAGIALSKYRNASQNLLMETFTFLSEITKKLDEISKQENTSQEIKECIEGIFEHVKPNVENCIRVGNEYTDALQNDYGKALELLVKVREAL